MIWNFEEIFKFCENPEVGILLKDSHHGLEREGLRISSEGKLAPTHHPEGLGSALTHPYITTDFSEAQLELITPYFNNERHTLRYLQRLQKVVYQHIGEEAIWPFSAPCQLSEDESDIPIAYYGTSNLGKERSLYRKGLSVRYGRRMQTLSGIHYNFSFSDLFWDKLWRKYGGDEDKKTFISNSYLNLIRNFFRFGWLTTYLFGSTPVVDASFLPQKPSELEYLDAFTLFGKDATSIRLSDLGYYSRVQSQVTISHNSLNEYLRDLSYVVKTTNPDYRKYNRDDHGQPLQLNDHYLQSESERYARIRPRPRIDRNRHVLDILSEEGITYVEVRSVDLNPFCPEGIDIDHLYFLHTFMLFCLFQESPPLESDDYPILRTNQNQVAICGRRTELELAHPSGSHVNMKEWANEIFQKLFEIAQLLDRIDQSRYVKSIQKNFEKINHVENTPSYQILNALKEKSIAFRDWGLSLAYHYQKESYQKLLQEITIKKFDEIAQNSLDKQKEMEIYDDWVLKGYEDLELSTQMIIREAMERGVKVEVLDRKENMLRLIKEDNVQYIKQGTMTAKDPLITYFLMENKAVSKLILQENGIRVPYGKTYVTLAELVQDYSSWQNRKVVVKPNLTNYGIGISFVQPEQKKEFYEAAKEAFKYGCEVIVEEFSEGSEYRFLVIGNQVVAVCQRLPANVTGDGNHTIRQLVKMKNRDPGSYKLKKYLIRLGAEEKTYLDHQGLDSSSIPEKGQRVFLRVNSNVSTGGDSIGIPRYLTQTYHEIVIQAAGAVKAEYCGVDMIIRDLSDRPNQDNYTIIELNFNPALFIHRYPASGPREHVEKTVLDHLGF